jgi:hypothetical protein
MSSGVIDLSLFAVVAPTRYWSFVRVAFRSQSMAAVPSAGSEPVVASPSGAGAPVSRFVGGVTSRAGGASGWARRGTTASSLAPSVGVGEGALVGALVIGGASTGGGIGARTAGGVGAGGGSVTAPTGTREDAAPARSGDARRIAANPSAHTPAIASTSTLMKTSRRC